MSFAIRLLMVLLVIFGATVFADIESNRIAEKEHAALQEATKPALTTSTMRIGTTSLFVEIASTEETRTRGLSGKMSLASDHGMLFVFPKAGIYRFWMPEMKFPLDIIWVGENKKVVGTSENAQPIVDESNITIYQPSSPIRYALEVNAGFVKANHIAPGESVDIF